LWGSGSHREVGNVFNSPTYRRFVAMRSTKSRTYQVPGTSALPIVVSVSGLGFELIFQRIQLTYGPQTLLSVILLVTFFFRRHGHQSTLRVSYTATSETQFTRLLGQQTSMSSDCCQSAHRDSYSIETFRPFPFFKRPSFLGSHI
jgi:hypothetical protein